MNTDDAQRALEQRALRNVRDLVDRLETEEEQRKRALRRSLVVAVVVVLLLAVAVAFIGLRTPWKGAAKVYELPPAAPSR